jgi:microcin C transport system permease protein
MTRKTLFALALFTIVVGILPLALDATLSDAFLPAPPPTPPDATHWLGTDDRGRDVLSRLLVGYRNSVVFAVAVTAAGCFLGFWLGCFQVMLGKKVDFVASRFEDAASSIPFIVVLMFLSTRFSGSFFPLFVVWSVNISIPMAYLVRAELLRSRDSDFLLAAKMQGASFFYLLRVHLLPLSATPLLVYFPLFVAGHLSALAAIDYLGLGLPPPTATIGELLRQGRENTRAWWILVPAITMLCLTLFGLQQWTERVRRQWNLR